MKIRSHEELDVYKMAFETAHIIYNKSKSFPKCELYSLTDQIRRSSRSVCANLAEAFRKRKYPKSFISKLNECESEAAETQVWIKFAYECDYINKVERDKIYKKYEQILGKLVNMSLHPEKWTY